MKTSFYSHKELIGLGLKALGENVLISRKTSFYGAEGISIGDNVRIDDFCILSGDICIGSNIHISAYCALYGSKGIEIEDYSGLSARVTLYSAMDDFSGSYLIGPIHPETLTNVTGGAIRIGKYVQVGAGSIVFPSVAIGEGGIVGAMSLVKNDIEPWTINAGIPTRFIKPRGRELIERLNKYDAQ